MANWTNKQCINAKERIVELEWCYSAAARYERIYCLLIASAAVWWLAFNVVISEPDRAASCQPWVPDLLRKGQRTHYMHACMTHFGILEKMCAKSMGHPSPPNYPNRINQIPFLQSDEFIAGALTRIKYRLTHANPTTHYPIIIRWLFYCMAFYYLWAG